MNADDASVLLTLINDGIERQEALIVQCRSVIDVFENQRAEVIRAVLKANKDE